MSADVVRPVSPESLEAAAAVLLAGGLVAFPTETVYGLGANAWNDEACRRIFAAKGRPADNPLIVHVADPDEARAVALTWPEVATAVVEAFWPGPLTVVLPAAARVPISVRAGLDTVAVRCPDHPVARALIRAAAVPLAAPSANRSGRPSPTTAQHVAEDLGDRVDLILDGGPTGIGVESTVIDLSVTPPVLLRPGGLAVEAIETVTGPLARPAPGGPARSPGMKYRHYAPDVPVILLALDSEAAVAYIQREWGPDDTAILAPTAVVGRLPGYRAADLGPSAETAARRLFRGLRDLDRTRPRRIVAVWNDEAGLGRAVWNRLEKAATEVRE
jgi:L-threonylcarbamoyladenylate synthase